MDLIKVFQRFPDHESCIEHLERVRWGDTPACPHCGGRQRGSQGRERPDRKLELS